MGNARGFRFLFRYVLFLSPNDLFIFGFGFIVFIGMMFMHIGSYWQPFGVIWLEGLGYPLIGVSWSINGGCFSFVPAVELKLK